jgi:hypothetical protein
MVLSVSEGYTLHFMQDIPAVLRIQKALLIDCMLLDRHGGRT